MMMGWGEIASLYADVFLLPKGLIGAMGEGVRLNRPYNAKNFLWQTS
jgi:hypothetical protein